MALTKLDLGSAPNDKTGTKLRAGGQLINNAFDQIDTNETDIATNAASIIINAAAIKLIQSRSFVSPSTAVISNTSSTVYVATDLLVAITPKSATSKLRVNFTAPFTGAANQTGGKVKVQSNIGLAGWNDVVFGNQTDTAIFRVANEATNLREQVSAITQIGSPGISDEVQFRVMFAGFTDTFNIDYADSLGMRMITVDEILED